MVMMQKKTPRDSTRSTARGVLLLGWVADDPLSQEINNSVPLYPLSQSINCLRQMMLQYGTSRL